jgi:hypothetical protein
LLNPRHTTGANVIPTENGWHLEIPPGEAGAYRLAQLDDYAGLPRGRFPLRAPSTLSLRCRVSEPALTPSPSPKGRGELSGTWGFGFWNDPFAFSFGLQGKPRRLPVLPNACWFFHASEENHLSFRPPIAEPAMGGPQGGHPGHGFLAQSFRSPKIPSLLLAPGVLGLPLLFSKTISKYLRAVVGKIIGEDSLLLDLDVTQWHTYNLSWRESRVSFSVDDAIVFETSVSPRGPLGVVIWIDNQYAAWTPEGRIGMGTLQQKTTGWMEIEQVEVRSER